MKRHRSAIKNFVFSMMLACSTAALPMSASLAAPETTATAAAEVGKKAPDFSLVDLDGKTVKLSDFKKKFVVLEWFNDGCPFVKKHYSSKNMQNLQNEYTKKGVVWVSICSSAPGKQGNRSASEYKTVLKDWNAKPTAFLLDPEGTVGRAYGAKTTPDMYVISKDGTLVYAGAIDDKADTDTESIKGAKNYVREALEQSMAGKNVAVGSTRPYGCSVKYHG